MPPSPPDYVARMLLYNTQELTVAPAPSLRTSAWPSRSDINTAAGCCYLHARGSLPCPCCGSGPPVLSDIVEKQKVWGVAPRPPSGCSLCDLSYTFIAHGSILESPLAARAKAPLLTASCDRPPAGRVKFCEHPYFTGVRMGPGCRSIGL